MINIKDVWNKLKEPGTVAKLRGIGDLLQYAISWSALFFIATLANADLAWSWAYATAATAVITHAIKLATNKTKWGERPDGGELSFPSGHTSGAFAGAWIYLFLFGATAAIVPLALACVVALSRVLAKKHHVRDVVGGALVALGVVAYFFA